MHLTAHTDYSLRLLMYVALKEGGHATIDEVASAYGISRNHLMKVAQRLGRHGILENARGRGGGLRLARPAARIGLGEVARLTEGGFDLVECFDAAHNSCRIVRSCRLKGVLREALDAWLAVLDRYTLADLTIRNPSLARVLFAA